MRVLHCVPVFSKLTQTFIYDLVSRQNSDENTRVAVLTWHRENVNERPFDPVYTVRPPTKFQQILIRASWLFASFVSVRLFLTGFERTVQNNIARFKPDLVHAHFGPTAVWVTRACKRAGVPVIVSFRGRDASAKISKWYWRRIYRSMLNSVAEITCVADFLCKNLLSLVPEEKRLHTIFTGKKNINISYREPHMMTGKLISVGRLVEKKGHLDAIRVVAALKTRGVTVFLKIVGDGPDFNLLQSEVDTLSLHNQVEFTGAVAYEEVLQLMSESDLLIAANRTAQNGDTEGIPNVIKEAMLVGLPVVATAHSGTPQVFPESLRAKLLVEGDIGGLSDWVSELLTEDLDSVMAITRKCRSYVLEHFSPEKEVEDYLALYRSLMETTRTKS